MSENLINPVENEHFWEARISPSEAKRVQMFLKDFQDIEAFPRFTISDFFHVLAPQNIHFDRFYKVCDMAKCHVRFIYKRNAFRSFGSLFAFSAQKVFVFDRFYKGFRNAFLAFEKPRFSLVL